MPLQPGDTLDRYVIDGPLGKGGMGEVYRAHDTRLERNVALKVVRVGETAAQQSGADSPSGGGSSRMLREARAAAALEHPNVVVIYDVGEVTQPETLKGTMFLAMELIAGHSMRAYIGDATVAMVERVRWLADVARALGAAHAKGLVHRDIKPENVMIREDGVVKVLDFGIAKRTGAVVDPKASVPTMTAEGIAVGTPYYMAPEQMRAEKLDGRADQFAWGVMAYELLSGALPWSRELDALQLVAEVLSKTPDLISTKNPDVPFAVAATVMRALSKSREQRFAAMGELLASMGATEVPAGAASTPQVSIPELASAPTVRAADPSAPTQGPTSSKAGHRPASQADSKKAEVDPPSAAGVGAPAVGAIAIGASQLGVSARGAPSSDARRRAWLLPTAAGVGVAALVGGGWYARRRPEAAPAASASAAVVLVRECETAKQCIAKNGGVAAICRQDTGACVRLESEDCKVEADPQAVGDDTTFWVGVMFPKTGPAAAEFGTDNLRGVELARRDFTSAVGGIPLQHPGGARPIGLLACDDVSAPERAARHLADEVHVPAVIGFGQSKEAVDLAEKVFIPDKVLVVASPNRSAFLSAVPQPAGEARLVWRTTPGIAQWARPIAALVAEVLEPELRAAGAAKDADPLRVAVVREKNDVGLTLSYALSTTLRFNGKLAPENGELYREIVVDDASGQEALAGTIPSALLAFRPHIVVLQLAPEDLAAVIGSLEEHWPAGATYRPRYVSTWFFWGKTFFDMVRVRDRRHRFLGIWPPIATAANTQLAAEYEEAFQTKISLTDTPASSYDAMYMLAYGAYVAGAGSLTGPGLSGALTRLSGSGPDIDVGRARLFDGLAALRNGSDINLGGTLTRLDYEPGSADPLTDFSILCVGTELGGNGGRESGMRYSASQKALQGTLRCP